MPKDTARVSRIDKHLAFGFGVAFLLIVVVSAFERPMPSDFTYTVLRIVLALAAGGVGAVLPGFIEVHFRNVLRAGGAVALFVVVYFFAPAPLSVATPPPPPPPESAARPVAQHFLELLDKGAYGEAYDSMATPFRSRYNFLDMREIVEAERKALGPKLSRVFDATAMAVDPPGAEKGQYINFGFRTKFANESRTIFELVSVYADDGVWKPVGFFTYVKGPSGQLTSFDPDELQASGVDGSSPPTELSDNGDSSTAAPRTPSAAP